MLALRFGRGHSLKISKITLEEAVQSEAVVELVGRFSEEALAALAAFCERPDEGVPGVSITDVVIDILAKSDLFREPLPPLGTLLRSVRLEVRDGSTSAGASVVRSVPDQCTSSPLQLADDEAYQGSKHTLDPWRWSRS